MFLHFACNFQWIICISLSYLGCTWWPVGPRRCLSAHSNCRYLNDFSAWGVIVWNLHPRCVFFGSFDKLCVCERRWITSTRWVLQCFWYICVRVQFKSDINHVTKGVVFYNDLQKFSYASISSPANPPRHPITDKLRITVSQPSVWLPMRHMGWAQKWKYIYIYRYALFFTWFCEFKQRRLFHRMLDST